MPRQTPKERLDTLANIVAEQKKISLEDMAHRLEVGERSVRRYVKELASQGVGIGIDDGFIIILRDEYEPVYAEDDDCLQDDSMAYAIRDYMRVKAPGEATRDELIEYMQTHYELSQSRAEEVLRFMEDCGVLELRGQTYWLRRTLLCRLRFTAEEAAKLFALIETRRSTGVAPLALRQAGEKLKRGLMRMGYRDVFKEMGRRRWVRFIKSGPVNSANFERGLAYIDGCISRFHKVKVTYAPRDGESCSLILDPLGVVYHRGMDDWYLIGRSGRAIRTLKGSRILGLFETWYSFDYPEDFQLEEYLAQSFGIDTSGKVEHVRIKFHNHGAVVQKVRRHMRHRDTARITELADGSIILEDKVRGLTEIQAWVRQFGYSAEVLEPEELRNRIIESARTLYREYSLHGPSIPQGREIYLKQDSENRPPEPRPAMSDETLAEVADLLWEAGEHGIKESEMAARLRLSCAQVRTAISRLEAAGLPVYSDLPDEDLAAACEEDDVRACTDSNQDVLWYVAACNRSYGPPVAFTERETEALVDMVTESGKPDPDLSSACRKLLECLTGRAIPDKPRPAGLRCPKILKFYPGLYEDEGIEERVLVLEDCAQRGVGAEFMYTPRPENGVPGERSVAPLSLVYYATRGLWYLLGVSTCGKSQHPWSPDLRCIEAFRLDRMSDLRVRPDMKFVYPESFRADDYLKHTWGMAINETPEKVVVRFRNDFGVVEKVLRQARLRSEAKVQVLEDGSIVYSDMIAGLDEFRTWLRGFGWSAMVIEPEHLRQAQKHTAEMLLVSYLENPMSAF